MFLILLISTLNLLGGAQAPSAGQTALTDAYQQWMLSCLDAQEKEIPLITASAEKAAALYVNENYELVLAGEDGFVSEMYGRAGGIIPIQSLQWWRRGRQPHGVLLYCLREGALQEDIATIQRLNNDGCQTILLGRPALTDEAVKAGVQTIAIINTYAAPHGGLFQAGDQWVVPTDQIARMSAEWSWLGEFIAACTRLGKMPIIWKSNGAEGGMDWNNKYRRNRYFDNIPTVIPAGKLAKDYLTETRKDLLVLYANELKRIVTVAQWALDARAAGHTVYTYSNGHAALNDPGCLHDPGYFKQFAKMNPPVDSNVVIKPGDVIYYIAQGGMPVEWGEFAKRNFPEEWRKGGAKIAWSFGNLYTPDFVRHIGLIKPDELFIDQHFAYADAAVWVDNFAIGLLANSGITSEALLWLTTAEVHGRLTLPAQPAPAKDAAAPAVK